MPPMDEGNEDPTFSSDGELSDSLIATVVRFISHTFFLNSCGCFNPTRLRAGAELEAVRMVTVERTLGTKQQTLDSFVHR